MQQMEGHVSLGESTLDLGWLNCINLGRPNFAEEAHYRFGPGLVELH